nr:M56 family metallopeptidase [uncultured Ruminococcus sp.]
MKNQLLVDWLLGLAHKLSPTYITYSWLIHTTIYVTITALFIILFKQIFKNRLRAKWHFLIWAVLLIRFIVPVLPASPVSVFNTVKVDENVIEQSSYQSIVTTPDNESVDPDDENQYTVAQGLQKMIEAEQNIGNHKSETTSGYTIQIDAIVTYVWLGGTIILLGYFITVLVIYRHRLKKSRRECGDLTLLDKCKEQLDIKRMVRVYYADTTPMLIGLFKPAIYVPEGLNEAELGATLLHELNHLKHFDILWSAIATIVLCLNWFNPIIWISFFMFKRDLEVYCDDRTLKHTENKQSYAMLLLKTATARKERFVLGTTSLQSGKADVKRRIRYMAKYKKLKAVGTVLAVVLVSTLLMGCLTNAGVFTKKTSTIENPANGCKMDIVLDKSFVGDDYLTGDGTVFEFHTDKPIEEIANQIISDNLEIGIMYQDDKQALFLSDNRDSFPYLLLTKRVSDRSGKDVENVVFLEALGTNTYIPSYTNALEMTGAYATEKKFSYYFPEHLRADYRYTNYKNHSYEVDQSNPFEHEIELIHGEDTFNQLCSFYSEIPIYRNPDIEIKEYDNGDGEILINNPSGQPVFKIFYNAKRNTVKYAPYAAFAAESASSVIYRLENAIQRQDRKLMESCFEYLSDSGYEQLSSIKPDFRVEKIIPANIDNVYFRYDYIAQVMIDYNDGMGYNRRNKRFTVEFIGEELKITYNQLSSFSENAITGESTESITHQARFINEKLGEPDLSDYNKTTFSKPPDILFADNSKAIIGGDCGIIVYSFEKNQITLYASYDYLRDLGLSIPFGNASSDGRIVYINDGAQSFAGVEQANGNYLHLVLDTQEKTIMENSGYYNSDTVERYSVYDLDDDTKEEYGMNNNYTGGSYVEYNDTIVYAQLKPNWEPENLSIIRYDKSDHKMEEFKLFS